MWRNRPAEGNCQVRKLIVGCGYLGRRVAARWREAGDDVFALTRSAERADEFRSSGITPVMGDVMQADSIAFPDDVDTCLYAIGLDRSSGFSQRDVYVNGLAGVLGNPTYRPRRLIWISSTSVYGQEAGETIDETSPTEPERDNGKVCLEAERLVLDFAKQSSGCTANVLRLSGIYGPNRLIARVAALKSAETMTGRGDAWLNLIHVDDAAGAVLACETKGSPGATYLISDDRPILRREFYGLVAGLEGAPLPTFTETTGPIGKRCNNSKAKRELGWSLRYPTIITGVPHSLWDFQ